jgi:hypothetical protein
VAGMQELKRNKKSCRGTNCRHDEKRNNLDILN